MTPSTEEEALRLVYRAIDELNLELPPDRRLEKSPGTTLFGRDGRLDSLGLVRLIVGVEQVIEDELSISVTLADERAVSQRSSPFRTVASLAAYVRERLEDRARVG
jgi:D-alanine--poly(phosphoribitol) ligase subunit 2